MRVKKFLPVVATAAAAAGVVMTGAAADAFVLDLGGGNTFNVELSLGCPTGACVAYEDGLSGGAVIDPAVTVPNHYKTPGEHFGDDAKVKSYRVTSVADSPDASALDPIVFSDLDNSLGFYWGSVDTHNDVTLFDGATALGTFNGQTLADSLDWAALGLNTVANPQGSFQEDVYITITGLGGTFDGAELTTGPIEELEPGETGVAFEIAVASVPEPTSLLGLGIAGLAGAGLLRKKENQSEDA